MQRILVVDDSDIFRKSLAAIVRTCAGWEVCGEANNADQGARVAEASKSDVVLMDISMPGMSGIEAIRHIRSKAPDSRIVIMSLHDSKQLVETALKAGASGYLVKPRADSDLFDALNAVIKARPTSALLLSWNERQGRSSAVIRLNVATSFGVMSLYPSFHSSQFWQDLGIDWIANETLLKISIRPTHRRSVQ